jgi:hypothetical protein
MKNLLAAATIVVSLGLAPAAFATPYGAQGYRSLSDTPIGNARTAQADTSMSAPNTYQNTGSASAALQGYTTSGLSMAQADTSMSAPNPYQNTGSASAALQGYTTSGNGGTPVAIVATGGGSFNWGDAGIGAAGAIGTTLILIGGSLVVLRRRSRLAV